MTIFAQIDLLGVCLALAIACFFVLRRLWSAEKAPSCHATAKISEASQAPVITGAKLTKALERVHTRTK